MAARRRTNTEATQDIAPAPRSLAVSAKGVATGEDFARLMSALMSDVIEGRIPPDVSNAAVNAGGKLLKVIEMQYKYGSREQEVQKPFRLVSEG